jgi:hypothetical protein
MKVQQLMAAEELTEPEDLATRSPRELSTLSSMLFHLRCY